MADGLSGFQFGQSLTDEVFGIGNVGGIGRFFVIDGTFVNEHALGIDDEEFGSDFGGIGLADGAVFIEEVGGGFGADFFGFGGGCIGRHVPLFAGGGRADGKPNDAIGGRGSLQFLHIAGGVVLYDEGATMIDPFEHDGFAFEIGEVVGLAAGIGEGKGRGGLTDFGGGEGQRGESEGGGEETG